MFWGDLYVEAINMNVKPSQMFPVTFTAVHSSLLSLLLPFESAFFFL
jgi:hypothetical protein